MVNSTGNKKFIVIDREKWSLPGMIAHGDFTVYCFILSYLFLC